MNKYVKPEDRPETVGVLVPWGGACPTGEDDEATTNPTDLVDDGSSPVPTDSDGSQRPN